MVPGDGELERRAREAWERRAPVRAATDAYRLLNGAFSGVPGLVVDAYADALVVQAYRPEWLGRAPDLAPMLSAVCGARGAVLKDRSDRAGSSGAEAPTRVLAGQPPEKLVINEGGLRFGVDLFHTQNVGLFLDTRPLRERLRREAPGLAVLNLFSYTCALGVAAAAGGAARVVNVDIAATYLERGRANLALNADADPAGRVEFRRMGAEEYLDWAARKGLRFDWILLDPPSFARHRGASFSFPRDYGRLVGKCAAVCAPGGRLSALTNYSRIGWEEFRSLVRNGCAPRRVMAQTPIPWPPDFDPPAPGAGGMEGPESTQKAVDNRLD